jgi:hypothetical protein
MNRRLITGMAFIISMLMPGCAGMDNEMASSAVDIPAASPPPNPAVIASPTPAKDDHLPAN